MGVENTRVYNVLTTLYVVSKFKSNSLFISDPDNILALSLLYEKSAPCATIAALNKGEFNYRYGEPSEHTYSSTEPCMKIQEINDAKMTKC